jgi:hypothetical protein
MNRAGTRGMERPRGRLTARGPASPLVNLRGADLREPPLYYLMLRDFFRSPTVRTGTTRRGLPNARCVNPRPAAAGSRGSGR